MTFITVPRTQTLSNNCVSATMAMVLQQSVEEVTEEFHQAYCNCTMTAAQYLTSKGLKCRSGLVEERHIPDNSVAILAVPSINFRTGMHSIILESNKDGEWLIRDPNDGYPDRVSYTHIVDEDGKVFLGSWVIEVLIDKVDLHAWLLLKESTYVNN